MTAPERDDSNSASGWPLPSETVELCACIACSSGRPYDCDRLHEVWTKRRRTAPACDRCGEPHVCRPGGAGFPETPGQSYGHCLVCGDAHACGEGARQ